MSISLSLSSQLSATPACLVHSPYSH
jgi:hypothetical protein